MSNYKATSTALKKRFKKQRSSADRHDRPRSLEPSGKLKRGDVLDKRRMIAFYFALAFVFIRFSMIHQFLEYRLHVDLYVVYFVGIPVFISVLATDGLKRAFQYRPAVYWTAFALWLIPTTLFSTFRRSSFEVVTGYYRTEFIMFFAIACLVTTWRECRWLIYTVACAAIFNMASLIFFGKFDDDGRAILPFGSVGNSNDYAGHLIFVLPFLLWIVLVTQSVRLRIAGFIALAVGIYQILAAGSRGAMLGLVTSIFVFALTTTSKLRRVILFTAPALVVLAIALLPSAVVHRIFLFSADNSEVSAGALESSQNREQLLRDSIRFTIQHPLFGLGPGTFGNNEGMQTRKSGLGSGLWYEAHNSFTGIASENGIPGFILYVGGILSSLLLLNKTGRLCRGKPDMNAIATAVLCLRIVMIGFCVTIFFLNFGYFFYLPALGGIAIAVAAASEKLVPDQTTGARKRKSKPVSNPLLALTREIVNTKK